jgi:ABC-type multidrug transport system fused ATPase/permease subunit
VEEYINEGGMLAIYPEATHMDGNWLGRFYLSYIRIGFETAALSNYEKEVFILPSTLYYEDFTALRSQCMIDFSEALSLQPFYEMYQANPRQTEAEVNEIIRHRVQEKMLNVNDVENYQQVMDFISFSETSVAERRQDVEMKELPQALSIRKEIEGKLHALEEQDKEKLEQIYSHTADYSKLLRKYRISDDSVRNPATPKQTANSALLYLLLLPFYLIGMLPHLPIYVITPLATRKLEDKLMYASIDICVWVLGIPIFYLIYFFLLGATGSWLFALIFILLLPIFGKFAHGYHRNFKQDFQRFRANLIRKNRKKSWEKMNRLREELDKDMESLM